MTTQPLADVPTRRRFTVDEYHRLGDLGFFGADERTELIEGEIVQMAPIGSKHAGHVTRLNSLLTTAVGERAMVSVQNPICLGDESEPQPDIALLRPREDYYVDAHPTASDVLLVVEVADSSLTFDRTNKIPLYARHDVGCVWLIDLRSKVVELFQRPVDGAYQSCRTLQSSQLLEHHELHIRLAVRDIFI